MKLKISLISLKVAVQSLSMWLIQHIDYVCQMQSVEHSTVQGVTLCLWMCGFWSSNEKQVDHEDCQDELLGYILARPDQSVTWVHTGKTWPVSYFGTYWQNLTSQLLGYILARPYQSVTWVHTGKTWPVTGWNFGKPVGTCGRCQVYRWIRPCKLQ
jgi:hypothetical protein